MKEHNPIALAISLLQNKWIEATKNKDYNFVRWVLDKKNIDIFKSFLKLESTPYGSLPETFVIMFTPFESDIEFTYSLMNDFLSIFEEENKKGIIPEWNDFSIFKDELSRVAIEKAKIKEINSLFIRMLTSFKTYENKKTKLVLGLLPYAISDFKKYTLWLSEILAILPPTIALMSIDDTNNETQKELFGKHFPQRISVFVDKVYDAGDVYKQIATSGNPDDPQVIFRRYLFEMGEAAQKGNKNKVKEWGEKILITTQESGDKLLWASAFLIYAGFLFSFREITKIEDLLNKGTRICENIFRDEELKPNVIGLLGQFYGYKGAFFNLQKKNKESVEWFEKQGDFMSDNHQFILAISAYQNAILIAQKGFKKELRRIVEKAFKIGYPLEDTLLQTSGFPIIAYNYLKYIEIDKIEKEEIIGRLNELYGENWQKRASKNMNIISEEYLSKL
mgnify:FL=1